MDKKEKLSGAYGHDNHEWGNRDDSEKIEWEKYYETRHKERLEDGDSDK